MNKRIAFSKRRFCFIAAAAMAALLVCASLLFLLAQTPWVKHKIARQSAAFLSDYTGQDIVIDGLTGILPGHIHLQTVDVANNQGKFITLHDLDVQLSWRALVRGQIHISRVHLAHLEVWQRPQPRERWRLPRLPGLPIWPRVDALHIDRLTLDEAVAGTRAVLRVSGHLAPSEGWMLPEISLSIQGLEAGTMQGELKFSFDKNAPRLTVQAVDEQLLPGLLRVPAPVALHLDGAGPRADWRAQLRATAGAEVLMEGSLHFTETEETALLADGVAYPNRVPPLAYYLPLMGEEISLHVAASLDRKGMLRMKETSVTSTVFSMHASGAVSLPEKHIDVTLNAAHENLSALMRHFPENTEGQLHLTLQGPTATPDLFLSAALNNVPSFEGQARLTVQDALTATGTARVLPSPALKTMLPGFPEQDLSITFDGSYDDEQGQLHLAALKGTLPGASLSVTGDINHAHPTFSLDSVLEVSDFTALAAWSPLSATGAATAHLVAFGEGDAFDFECTVDSPVWRMEEAGLREMHIACSGSGKDWLALKPTQVQAVFSVKMEEMHVRDFSCKPLSLEAALDMQEWGLLEMEGFRLSDENITVTGRGQINLEEQKGSINTEVQIAALDTLPLPGATLPSGTGVASILLEGGWSPWQGKGTVSGKLTELAHLPTLVQACIKDALIFSSDFELQNNLAILTSLSVSGDQVQLSGHGSYALDVAEANAYFEAELPDLGALGHALQHPLAGAGSATLILSGSWPDLTLVAEADGRNLTYGSGPALTAHIKTEAAQVPRHPEVSVTAALDDGNRQAELKGRASLDSERFLVSSVAAVSGDNRIAGKGSLVLETREIEADLDAALNNLAELAYWAGMNVEGKAAGSLSFARETGRLTVDVQQCRMDKLYLEQLSSSIQVSDPWTQPSGTGVVTARNMTVGAARLTALELNASGGMEELHFNASCDGSVESGAQPSSAVSCDAEGVLFPFKKQLALTTFKGAVGEFAYAMADKALVLVHENALTVDPIALEVGEGRLFFQGRFLSQSLDGQFRVESFPVSLTRLFLTPAYTGKLDGQIDLSGSPAAPIIHASFALSEGRLEMESAEGFAPLEAQLQATYSERNARAIVSADMSTIMDWDAQGEFPLNMQFHPFSLELPPQGRCKGTMSMMLEVNPLLEALGLAEHHFDGKLEAQFQWDGRVEAPDLSGSAVIQKGRYEHAQSGAVLDSIHLNMVAAGTRLHIEECRAGAGARGTISATGDIFLTPEKRFPMEINLSLENAQFAQLDYLRGRIHGNLAAKGTMEGVTLSGKVVLDPIHISMPEHLPVKEPVALEVMEIRNNEVIAPPGQPRRLMASRASLDIHCAIPNKAYVRAPILDSEWGGNLHITGSLAEPMVAGRIAVARGHLDFLGRRFMLQDSSVLFPGDAPTALWLDMKAETQTSTVAAQLSVTGDLNGVKLELSSEPALPQDEVLAQVLFGRDLAHISPVQAIQLARIAAMFNRGLAGLHVFSGNIGLPGIDRLDIRTGERTEDTVVGVGKYFTDSVYVEVEQGAASDSSKVSVEVEVTPRISVKGDVDARERSGVGLFWNKDY